MRTFKLELSEQEIAVVSEALGAAPFNRVAPVINAIQAQINAQADPLTKPAKTPTVEPQEE